MISVKTFLVEHGDHNYVYVEVAELDELPSKPRGEDQLGAIELTINGVVVLQRHMLDEIDGIWGHMAMLLDDYRNGREAVMGFPSNMSKLSFGRIGRGQVVVASVWGENRIAAAADEHELLSAIQSAGYTYFDKMETLTQRFYAKERTLLSGHNPHLST
jgi:hypothetical protein